VKRANDGDHRAQAWLRRVLDEYPQLWEQAGDLALHAQLSLIRLISKGEWFLGEALKRRLEELRRDLEDPFSTPLEKLAVERVVAAWANLYYVEAVYLSVQGDLVERKYWLKKQDQAHRQYLAATKSLMLVRTMLERATPPLPVGSRGRFQPAMHSDPPGGNGFAGNGLGGSSSVPGFAADREASEQVTRCNGHATNRIAALVGGAH
jgi:hypothetical protein